MAGVGEQGQRNIRHSGLLHAPGNIGHCLAMVAAGVGGASQQMNRQIGGICAAAIDYGFKNFIFSTNGYFCTPDRLAELPRGAGDVSYQLCI